MQNFKFILLFFVSTGLFSCNQNQLSIKKIALIGRYQDLEGKSGSNEWYDTFVEKSLKTFLNELNQKTEPVNFE